MIHLDETNSKTKYTPKRVFVSHARVLPDEKRGALSEQEKGFEKSCRERGVWLEIFCPDNVCMTEEERTGIPVFCEDPQLKKNILFEIFCPEDSCEAFEATRLP